MKFIFSLLFSFLLSFNLVCQFVDSNYQSKHVKEVAEHIPADYIFESEGNIQSIVPINQTKRKDLTHSVFGYLPYWQYPEALDNLQYDLLTHIAVFDFGINSNGSVEYPPNWPWVDLINSSHENGVAVILTAVNFNGSQIHTFLTDPSVKYNLFENLLNIIQQYSLDGVNVDFENVASSDRGELLTDFMNELTEYLHNVNSSYEVSFAAPPINWGGWDFEDLASSCDYLFVMGYDFYGSWSSTSGACAPLAGGTYNITNVILEEYYDVVQNTPDKLILGVPYYGNSWKTQNSQSYSNIIDHISQPSYETAMNRAELDTLLWDTTSETSWSYYLSNSNYYQTWFDTDSSLCLKYNLAENQLLKGVGMWALGYDGSRTELWDELRRHFEIPTTIKDLTSKKNSLLKIYPNPSKGNITIDIYVEQNNQYTIEIIDLRGKVILKKPSLPIDQNGILSYNFDLHIMDPGLYFILCKESSRIGQRLITKRIILQ